MGVQRRLQGVKKEENLESGWAAGQCEMGTHSSQPPLNPLNSPAEGRRGQLKTLAKMSFTQRVQRCPVCSHPLWVLPLPHCCLLHPRARGIWLLLAEVEPRIPPRCGAVLGCSSPVLHPFLSASPLLPILPSSNHVLNTLQMLLDVFLTRFSPQPPQSTLSE